MTPEFAAFQQRYRRAIPQGLVAAAALYHGTIRAKLQRGYTTGAYVTGATAASVQMTPPASDGDRWTVRVGTPSLVALYWELGHHNVFTKRYERVEYWRETLGLLAPEMARLAGGTMSTIIETGAAPDVAYPS